MKGSAAPGPLAGEVSRRAQEERLLAVWSAGKGFRYWSAVNNTEIGLWYTATTFLFMLFGGVLALLIRAQLAVPENDLLSAGTYNQVFTLHGTVMMFLFAVPMFEAVAILLLSQMLGARDLPFPRLSAYGFWCFAIGGVFVCGSIFFGAAPDGGWFMYPPLSTDTEQAGIGADIWLLGLGFIRRTLCEQQSLDAFHAECRNHKRQLNAFCYVIDKLISNAGFAMMAGVPSRQLELGLHRSDNFETVFKRICSTDMVLDNYFYYGYIAGSPPLTGVWP